MGTQMINRGRPAGVMTHRRQQIFERYADAAADGATVSFARLARECGLYDYREARRIVRDLERIGKIAAGI